MREVRRLRSLRERRLSGVRMTVWALSSLEVHALPLPAPQRDLGGERHDDGEPARGARPTLQLLPTLSGHRTRRTCVVWVGYRGDGTGVFSHEESLPAGYDSPRARVADGPTPSLAVEASAQGQIVAAAANAGTTSGGSSTRLQWCGLCVEVLATPRSRPSSAEGLSASLGTAPGPRPLVLDRL